ncbi:MAG: hypothetical protein ACO1TE_11680 [Prosthecobacter sp.]
MFKHFIWLGIITMMFGTVAAHADGMPYSGIGGKHRAIRFEEYLSLQMSDEQMVEAARTGVITFHPSQLKRLRLIYPKFPEKSGLYSSTHNDGFEPGWPEAYVIWWHADEVVVTLDEAVPGQEVIMPSIEPVTPPEDTLFRLSPDARIYHQTKAVSLKQAFQLLDALAKAGAPGKEDGPHWMVIPPPPRRSVSLHESMRDELPDSVAVGETYDAVLHIAETLRTYARTQGISLSNCW